uniref:Uncharacterized protein n=1 Tax=Rhodosorus marinus TaxID=101924 RepID=A0A7S3A832_9RHOD|mmetsp:Transcript_4501/g.19261  ORF Transcript_4501/g.19261 Transcript_4501/m.19261 type:complete len:111 (+) Transcript_4501:762-1094(+)
MVLESWNRCWPEDTLLVICKRTASNSRRVDMRYREYQNAQEPTAGAVLSPNSTPAFRSSLKTSRLTKFAPIYRLILIQSTKIGLEKSSNECFKLTDEHQVCSGHDPEVQD